MDVQHTNSITGVGSPASAAVASSLTTRRTTANATTGAAKPMAASASGSSGSASGAAADSADITSSDFLTLLVSELQNQDPTQPADPNAYISQLVGVNSLQQLIQINSGIGSLDSAVSSPSSSSSGSAVSSGSNANAVENANAVANTNSAFGLQPGPGQNSIWGGGTSS
jgi:flagellar basal-body rod modification protein FlgD